MLIRDLLNWLFRSRRRSNNFGSYLESRAAEMEAFFGFNPIETSQQRLLDAKRRELDQMEEALRLKKRELELQREAEQLVL